MKSKITMKSKLRKRLEQISIRSKTAKAIKVGSMLAFISLQSFNLSLAQKISLHFKNAKLETALHAIRKESGYQLVYNSDLIKNSKLVTIDITNKSLDSALDKLLENQAITYRIEQNTIILIAKKRELPMKVIQINQQIKVTGRVIDKDGTALSGVSVKETGTTNATLTDKNGFFRLNFKNLTGTIEFSFVGFSPLVLTPSTDEMQVQMLADDKALDEVVVVGYGKQKKLSVVSSVSTVKGEELRFPNRNLTNNLAGQVAGLIAVQRSGEPGYDNAEFWIRGISSFAGGSSPLVLVDGVPRGIADIEPDEIDTFTVLKDAAATAVYGAEGANGVVIITSKRGRVEKPVISFRTEHSFLKPTRLPEFVGSADYLSLFNEALINDGEKPIYTDEFIAKYRDHVDSDLYPNTNWMKELLRSSTDNHRYTLNVRGGSEKAKYFVSGAYFSEKGVFKDNPNDRYKTNIGLKRFNLRSNIDLEVTKTTQVSVDLSGQYLLTNYPGTGTGTIFRQMLLTPPYVFPAVYSDGTIATFEKERDANMRNPYNMLMNSGYAKEWRSSIQSNVNLLQDLKFITEGLRFRANLSYDYYGNYYMSRTYNPSRYYATGRDENGKLIFNRTFSGSPDLSDPSQRSDSNKKIYMESALNYNRSFGFHNVGVMALYMQKESQNFDQPLPNRKQGIVGRLTYGFDNRYFLEGNFGYTGSETFAKGYRYGFFPAVGIGYQISNEPFYPESLKPYVNSLKMRFSTGRTGNDNTGGARFLYRPTFNMDAGGFNQGITSGGGSNGLGNGIAEARFEAPYLGWEIEDKFNYGVDVSLFKDAVQITADYFTSERSGILLQRRTVLQSAGYRQAPWQNYGRVKNSGVDGSISSNHKVGNVQIGTRGTFTFARNRILEYDELPQPYPWMAVTGRRVSENYVYIAERLYTVDDFDISQGSNGNTQYNLKQGIAKPTLGGKIAPGDIKYEDLNNDGVIDEFDRKRGVGNPYIPEVVYGFGFNVSYRGFYVSTFFQGVANSSVMLGGDNAAGWYPFAWGVDQSNYRTFALDRWTSDNPSQEVVMPRLHSSNSNSANNNVGSTWWMRNGNFLRFKNLEIGYNLPKNMLEKYKIKNTRIYMMGNNLHVWDTIKYWDPETGNSNAGFNYPNPRTLTLGLEMSF